MPIDKYFVVRHHNEWKIKHNGKHSKPYPTELAAITDAIKWAKATQDGGRNAHVLVQDEHLNFRTEWTYGMDPNENP
jgi:uncharacterized protein DUF2188